MGNQNKISAKELSLKYNIEKKSLREIANEFGCSSSNILYWLKKYEIPIRTIKEAKKRAINTNFFKKLNPESAFLLGYLFSDGDLLLNKKTGKHFLRLYSKYKDNIEKVRVLLSTDAKIQYRKEVFNEKERKGALYFIHIPDQEIVNDLMKLGMVYDKNQSIKYPQIPKKLDSHFIRGLWAGSGSIYFEKKYLRAKLVFGSISLIKDVERILFENSLSKRKIYESSHTKKPSYSIRYNSKKDLELFYKYLFYGSNIGLYDQRQFEKFRSYYA